MDFDSLGIIVVQTEAVMTGIEIQGLNKSYGNLMRTCRHVDCVIGDLLHFFDVIIAGMSNGVNWAH